MKTLITVLACMVVAAAASAATLVDLPLGSVIDPAGVEGVDQSFGSTEATLEARSDLQVLQNFTGFAAGGNNVVSFTSPTLPDIQFQFAGNYAADKAGQEHLTWDGISTSDDSALEMRNSAAGTSSLTISFGTWNGSSFAGNQTVGAAGFTLANVYVERTGVVDFYDGSGTLITGASFSFSGASNADGSGNHKDFYFGWDSASESTSEIGSIVITTADSITGGSGFDDFAFTSTAAGGGDTTPPVWEATYPKVDTVTATGATARAAIDEGGTASYVVVADAAPAPTSAEVKAGTGSGGSGQVASGSIALAAATEGTDAITGLSESTAYDVYFVAEDDEGTPNLQADGDVVKVDITTISASPSAVVVIDEGLDNSGIDSTVSSVGKEAKAVNFVMGAGSDYTLTTVVLGFAAVAGDEIPIIEIWSDDGTSAPMGTLLETLSNPGTLANGANTFTSVGLTLEASATYWVVANGANANAYSWLGNNVDTSVTSDIGATHNGRLYTSVTASPGDWTQGSSVLNQIQVNAVVLGGDTTPPVWEATYPKVDTVTATGATARAAIDEGGTASYVVVADAAPAPTPAEVKAGTGSGGSGQVASGSIALAAATEGTDAITGLSESTAYDVYFVAEDDEGTPNLQADGDVVKVDITTATPDATAPTWTALYPQVDTPTSDGFTTHAAINEPGTAYYVVVADPSSAPTAAQITNGLNSAGASALASGSISLTVADSPETDTVTGLSPSTAYDVYFVAEDDEGSPNVQVSVEKVDITTAGAPVTMALFEFTSGSASSSDADASTTASDMTISTGISGEALANNRLEIGGNDTLFTSTAANIGAQLQNAVDNDMYFTFTLTIPGGPVVNLTSLSLSYTANNAYHFGIGVFADKTGFSYPSPDNSLYGFYTHSTVSTNIVIDLSGAAFQGLTGTTVEFRVYTSDGSTSVTRQHEFDDIVLVGTLEPDTTAPAWDATYPQVDTETSVGATALAQIDEAGTAYYVVLADGASAPSSAQVKAGTDAANAAAPTSGSIALSASTEGTDVFSALSASTAYDVYFVAEDGSANLQASPELVEFTTTPPPAVVVVWSDAATSNVTTTSAWATATVNPSLDVCVLVWEEAATAPGPGPGTTNDWTYRLSLGGQATGSVTTQMTSLAAGETYAWRFYGESGSTNGWSDAVTFSTLEQPDVSHGGGANVIGVDSATLWGTLSSGTVVNAWICYAESEPASPDSTSNWANVESIGEVTEAPPFSATISGLDWETGYAARLFVSNTVGTAWSTTTNFTTAAYPGLVKYASGAMTWDTNSVNWGTSSGGPYDAVPWINTGLDSAVFEGASSYAVTVDDDIYITNLLFTATASGCALSGGSLNFSEGGSITQGIKNAKHTITSPITGSPSVAVRDGGTYEGLIFAPTSGSQTLGDCIVPYEGGTGDKAGIEFGGTTTSNSVVSVGYTGGHYGTLWKTGSGTWTVGDIDIGTVRISGGLLVVNGTVNTRYNTLYMTGGLLGGVATVTRADRRSTFDFVSGSGMAPGDGVGQITFDWGTSGTPSVTQWTTYLRAGSTYEWEVGSGSNDIVYIEDGRLVLEGFTLKIQDAGGAPAATNQLTVFTYGTLDSKTLALGSVVFDTSSLGPQWSTNSLTLTDDGAGTIYLTGLSRDVTPPTVTEIDDGDVDDLVGVGDVLTYSVTFSEPIDGATVDTNDFDNGAASSPATITVDSVTQNSSTNFTVQVTTVAAGDLQLRIPTGAVITDVASNSLGVPVLDGDTVSVVFDETGPSVTDIDDGAGGGPVEVNNILTYTVTFDEPIDGSIVDTNDFDNGASSPATISVDSVSQTSPTTFTVQVTPTAAGNLQLRIPVGATIADVLGNNLVPPQQDDLIVTVNPDTSGPTVTAVSSTTPDGTYGLNLVIAVTVAFSEVVTVTGTPQLTLENGTSDAVGVYTNGSGSSALTFAYTVQAGDTSTDLDYVATNSLSLNGGTIKDGEGIDADLTLPEPGQAGSLSVNSAVVIDTTAPTPNPMEFLVLPYKVDSSSIAMTASNATDVLASPVEYRFMNTTNGNDSGWISQSSWTNSGLLGNLTYGYQVKARDAVSNETAWSSVVSVFLLRPDQTVYWDGPLSSGVGNGASDGGAGTWSTSVANWDQGNGLDQGVWYSGSDTAILGGTPGAVSVSGTISVSNVNFAASTSGYAIQDGLLAFVSGGSITQSVKNAKHTITSPITGSPNVAVRDGGTYEGLIFAPTSGSQTLGDCIVPYEGSTGDKAGIELGGTTTGNSVVSVGYTGGHYGKLWKSGSGTWSVVGDIEIGAVEVTGGTLLANGALNTFYNNVTINSGGKLIALGSVDIPSGRAFVITTGGILAGTGTIKDPLTIAADGILAPGNPTGILTVSNDCTINGTLRITIDGSESPVNGAIDVAQALDVSGATLELPAPGSIASQSYVLAQYGSLVGPFAATNNLPSNWMIDYAYQGNTQIAAVPRPGTLFMFR